MRRLKADLKALAQDFPERQVVRLSMACPKTRPSSVAGAWRLRLDAGRVRALGCGRLNQDGEVRVGILLGLLLLAWPSVESPHRTGAVSPLDAAVVISGARYPFLAEGVPYATEDGDGFEAFFLYTRGVPRERVHRLVDAHSATVRAHFAEAAAQAAGGTLWLYFAGHSAVLRSGERVLVAADAVSLDAQHWYGDRGSEDERAGGREAPGRTAAQAGLIPLRELIALGERSAARQVVVVLDACQLSAGTRPLVSPKAQASSRKVLIWSATASGEVAGPLPSVGHGAFTYAALGALRGWADGELSGRADGEITAGEAQRYVARVLGALDRRGQTPTLTGDDGWVLSTGSEPTPPGPCPGGEGWQARCEPAPLAVRPTCWPGQRLVGERCVGEPRCPEPLRAVDGRCQAVVCEGGKTLAADGHHCCWPEQRWSEGRGCEGRPQCPAGLAVDGDGLSCFDVEARQQAVEAALLAERAKAQAAEEEAKAAEARALAQAAEAQAAAESKAREQATLAEQRAASVGLKWVRLTGGPFYMGAKAGVGAPDERPRREVTVGDFWLSETEVTNAQYQRCVDQGGCTEPAEDRCLATRLGLFPFLASRPSGLYEPNHPVVCVDWAQAQAFARWVGGRLPTEAEWEYAARGQGQEQAYPWGDAPPTEALAVMRGRRPTTAPVCQAQGKSPQGLCDLAGNAEEWVADRYGSYPDAPRDGTAQPVGKNRVARGGSWLSEARELTSTARAHRRPDLTAAFLGFRVAKAP